MNAEAGVRPDDGDHERVMSEVSDALLVIEHAIKRTKKARVEAAKHEYEANAELALKEAAAGLEATRKRLMRDAYYRQDSLRLL